MLVLKELRRPQLAPTSFMLAAGECAALTGASGAGKTLLLRAIADLDPNEGEVEVDAVKRSAVAAPQWRRQVAYVAGESAWWDETVAQHFREPAEARGQLATVGLAPDALDWPVSRLSSGERQRLGLLRALAPRPRALLLDEPTSALDPDTTLQVEALLHRLLQEGMAILLVTHDPAQAARLASRRLVIEAGRVREEGR